MKSLVLLLSACAALLPLSARAFQPLPDVYTSAVNPANGHTYYLLTESNWSAAETVAQSLGGHLATVRNAVENQFIFDAFAHYGGVERALWIGLNDAATEGTYVWTSGEPFSYSNWDSGQPDNASNEDFVHIFQAGSPIYTATKWNDLADVSSLGSAIPLLNGVVEVIPPTPPGPVTTTLALKGAEVPGAGVDGSDVPAGAVWYGFGVPAIAPVRIYAALGMEGPAVQVGSAAFIAKLKSPTGTQTSVVRRAPDGTVQVLATLKATPLQFSGFKDPLIDEAGTVLFVAAQKLGTVKVEGIWMRSNFAIQGQTQFPAPVATTLDDVPGVGGAAQWKSFTSVALADDMVAFTASLVQGLGEVTAADDTGLWLRVFGDYTTLAMREGGTLTLGEGSVKTVKSFTALKAVPGAAGQGHGAAGQGVTAKVTFTDKTQELVRFYPGGYYSVAKAGLPVFGTDETLLKTGVATQSSGGGAAFTAKLSGPGNASGALLFTGDGGVGLLARQGEQAMAFDAALFNAFGTVALGSEGNAAFVAKLKGGTATSASDLALFRVRYGTQLMAREGMEAPGAGGAVFKSFTSVAMPDGATGPVFVAKLLVPKTGEPNPAGVTSKNAVGLWYTDDAGTAHLLARAGDTVEGKTLRAFTILSNVSRSSSQARSYNNAGELIYRAFYTDGTSALLHVQLPPPYSIPL